jgi:hypothetical protein
MANDESRAQRAQLQWRLGRRVVVSYPCLEGCGLQERARQAGARRSRER